MRTENYTRETPEEKVIEQKEEPNPPKTEPEKPEPESEKTGEKAEEKVKIPVKKKKAKKKVSEPKDDGNRDLREKVNRLKEVLNK